MMSLYNIFFFSLQKYKYSVIINNVLLFFFINIL